jgi:hypothetical protein
LRPAARNFATIFHDLPEARRMRTARIRPSLAVAFGVTAMLGLPGTAWSQDAARPPAGLSRVLEPGWLIEDRNGDDVVDFVLARIVLPFAPGEADVVAAANVAARLGYETSALDLGFTERVPDRPSGYDVPVVLIGAVALPLPEPAAADGLAPGQGALAFVRPGGLVRAGGIHVAGGDASGLLAAAAYFASRYPQIWPVRGATYDSLTSRVSRFLEQREIRPDSLYLVRIVVEANRPGVSRAELRIVLPDSALFARTQEAFEEDSTAAGGADAGDAGAGGAGAGAGRRVRRTDLQFTDLRRIDVLLRAPGESSVIRLLPIRPWDTRPGNAFNAREAPDFTLSDLYTIRGLYRDTNQDQVPDRTEAFLSVSGTDAAEALADFAARVGLESAGMRLPFARVDAEEDRPQEAGFPIVFGVDHFQTTRLRREGLLATDPLPAGTGFLELVPRGFGAGPGLVFGGADADGLAAITGHAAARMPYLWDHGKGNYRLADVENEVRRFFQARGAAGQVALALHKLDVWLERLEGDIDSVDVELAVQEAPPGLTALIERRLRTRFPRAGQRVSTVPTGFGVGDTIFVQNVRFPWEVDAFWSAFRERALPDIGATSRGRIEVRVSEAPEVRAALARGIRAELRGRGVADDAFEVVVLNAFKQGYSWLEDVILPELRGKDIAAVEIAYHALGQSDEVRWQVIESDTRWLQEIYPVDAVLARELNIPDSLITFRATRRAEPIYRVIARAPDGSELLNETFDPKYTVRPFFDLFPDYEQLRVTTGWVTVMADGRALLDERVRTDPETFWDFLQTETFARIVDYTMDVQDGRPSAGNAPFFDEFRVELTLSEPNHRIGIDEEVISSVEALHEDIYFETLTLFDLLAGRYGLNNLNHAGRVLPYIKPPVNGQPGHARITFTGKQNAVPELVFTYRERGQEPRRHEYDLGALPTEPPMLRAIRVHAERPGIEGLLFDVTAIDSTDRYEEYRERATEQQIDRTFLAVPLLDGMLAQLRGLHEDGLFRDALAWDRIAQLGIRYVLDDTASRFRKRATLARSTSPAGTDVPRLHDDEFRWNGQRIVQWDTPIPPAENDAILAKLATFPPANVYRVGRSFLGQDIYAADFLPPHDAKYISQAKRNALKPTLLLSGRQHANEVSSTSHILRLGELLATDSAYTRLLKHANVVLHPITNPDGARLAYEMQLENPDFMLHAGYLGALGVDATSGGGSDPIYPESRVRPELQDTWLPDISMNLHGYPSHEWVQLFAGYSAWVRGRTGTQRSWWAPRGWFIPGFSWVDDPRAPEIRTAQFAILDSIAAAITREPAVEAMNRRMYARYAKYGKQDIENFREYFHNGILVYSALRGRETAGQGANSARITYFSVTTEAPDETARGDWLELVASAGLAHTSALLRYLASGEYEINRETTEFADFVVRTAARRKPVLPKKPADATSNGGG